MNFVAYLIIAATSVGLLSNCKPKESSKNAGETSSHITPPGKKETTVDRPDISGEGKNFKDARGQAMNRNELTQSLLSRVKPDWLVLGPPVAAEEYPAKDETQSWKGLEKAIFTKSGPETVSEVGGVKVPEILSSIQWSSASFDPGGGRILMVPLEMTEPASLFKVEEGKIVEDSREEIPSINYDDKRRWFIQWDAWISDSEIVGVFNEDDSSGHTIVRAGIYLYNVNNKELRRVDLPYGFITGNDPTLEIVSVSPNGLLVGTADGEKTLSLKK